MPLWEHNDGPLCYSIKINSSMRIRDNKSENLRRDYKSNTLSMGEVSDNPISQFQKWFDEAIAAAVLEPNAMTLATVSEAGCPSARIVLLKGFNENGFFFYTNYQSRKAKQMAANPNVALVFNWLELERQVRIEGRVQLAAPDVSTRYYDSRPKGSRIGAWVSPQSSAIPSRDFLQDRVGQLTTLLDGKEAIPRPPFWGGYLVIPTHIEFWQGRSSRLHDRISYHRHQDEWHLERLAP